MKEICIFDVDDTLIDTKACIHAVDKKTGEIVFKVGTQVYNAPDSTDKLLSTDLEWDFGEFESLDQICSEPKLPSWNALVQAYNDGKQIFIITARQNRQMLFSWLTQEGINIPFGNIMCYNAKLHETVSDFKGSMIKLIIDNVPGPLRIHLWDDDKNNIKSMIETCEKYHVEFVNHGV